MFKVFKTTCFIKVPLKNSLQWLNVHLHRYYFKLIFENHARFIRRTNKFNNPTDTPCITRVVCDIYKSLQSKNRDYRPLQWVPTFTKSNPSLLWHCSCASKIHISEISSSRHALGSRETASGVSGTRLLPIIIIVSGDHRDVSSPSASNSLSSDSRSFRVVPLTVTN